MIITREMNLSPQMIETVRKIFKYGKLVRYDGGFWSWEGCECDRDRCPIWWCDAKTLHALERRGLVNLDERDKKEVTLVPQY